MKKHPNPLHPQGHARQSLMAAALSVSLMPLAHADYASEVLSENPLAYYRFDDAVATDDISTPEVNLGSLGAPGNGILTDAFVRQAVGALPGSTDVAGGVNGTSLSVPFNAALNKQGSFSVEVWLKPTTIPAAGALVSPIASWRENPAEATGREGWLIYQGDAATGFNFRTYNKNAAAVAVSITSGAGVTAGAWHHVVVTWDDTAAIGKIYVNGVLKNTSPVIAPAAPLRPFEANSVSPFVIGARSDGAFAWTGSVDEPAYYGTVLTDAQVLAHYNNGISPTPPSPAYDTLVLGEAPVGYWRMNNSYVFRTPPPAANAGSLGATAIGKYYAGSKNSSTGPSTSSGFSGFGSSNSALSLANANGYVSSGLSLLNNRTAFTVTGWVKRGAVHSVRGGYFGQNDLLEFGDTAAGASIEVYINAGGSLGTAYTAADDIWQFIALTGSGTSNTLYIDGVQVTEAVTPIANYGTSAFNFNIGGGGIFAATGDYFRGEIDEVAVFDKALTAGRIKQLFDTALGNVEPGIVNQIPSVSPAGAVPEGQPYTLSVDVTGTPPFTYQWLLNGSPIGGATSKTYAVPAAAANVPQGDPYIYSVAVTNGVKTVTSDPIEVYITPVLKWTSTAATNADKWDIDTITPSPLNWKTFTTNVAKAYTDDYAVQFDDTAAATSVQLTQDVFPLAVVFDNTTKDYTLTGEFTVRGSIPAISTKKGTGTVVIANSVYDVDFFDVAAGKLQIGNGTTGALGTSTVARVAGGELALNLATGSTYLNKTTTTGGMVSFGGTGDLSVTAEITGTANEVFNGTGVTTINGLNTVAGTVTVSSGTASFDGSQNANRLAAGKVVTVNPGAAMEIHGVNALPSGVNSVNPTLNQATLRVFSGGSTAVGAAGQSHAHLGTLTLDAASVVLPYSGQGSAYNGESFQLNGDIVVTGSGASSIALGAGANTGNAGIAVSAAKTHTVTVPNVVIGADLTIAAEIENADSTTAPTVLAKTGEGTLLLANGIAHSYSGATQINEGTLLASGSIVGPVAIAAPAFLDPGPSTATFTTGALTLDGTYSVEINGATADRLVVNGSATIGAAGKITFSVLGGGATAPLYEVLTTTSPIIGTPIVTGIPAGYSLVVSSTSIAIIQSGADTQPKVALATPSGSENFNTNPGGFTVSAAVSPETDWAYTTGSWLSTGQINGTAGDDNTSNLISPIYTVTQAGPITLSFSHRYSFEADFDGGAVSVSVNGGAFNLVPLTAFSQNGYNGVIPAGVTHSLKGLDGFVGNSTGHPAFITSICTLTTGAVGDTIQVRFISASDNNTVGNLTPAGWEIDSFDITNALPQLMTLTWPLGTMQYSDNLQPPWVDLAGKSPLLIDTKAAPKRFFRLKP